jgi:hypothetical protein
MMRRVISAFLSGFKYLIGVFMMIAGVDTMRAPVDPGSDLGFLYESRVALVIYGIIFFASGLWLVVAKIVHCNRHVGWSLMAIYLCFLYAGILNCAADGMEAGCPNLIAAMILGGLYLRWKYHIFYADRVDTPRPVV